MERYDIAMDAIDSMITDADGAWVRYDDARCEIAGLQAQLTAAHAALMDLKENGATVDDALVAIGLVKELLG